MDSVPRISVGGSHEATFESFVRTRSMALYRTAYLLTGDAPVAEDLLQTALERTYRHWRRVAAMEFPEAYVRQVIVNLATDRWRRRRSVVEVEFDDEAAVHARDAVADHASVADLREALLTGLRRLPDAMRTVLVLRYWEGLPEAEVAGLLGCSVGTVKSQASRGLARLRRTTAHLFDRAHSPALESRCS